ncbi:hypothetical protein D9M71_345690 [compost metagenome]
MSQGEDRAAGDQGNLPGTCGQVGQISEGIEYLPCIAEMWIEKRYIPYPDGGKAKAVYLAHQVSLTRQYRHIPFIETQWQEDSHGQLAGGKHTTVAGMAGKGRSIGAMGRGGCCVVRCLVHSRSLVVGFTGRLQAQAGKCHVARRGVD